MQREQVNYAVIYFDLQLVDLAVAADGVVTVRKAAN